MTLAEAELRCRFAAEQTERAVAYERACLIERDRLRLEAARIEARDIRAARRLGIVVVGEGGRHGAN